MDHTLPVRMLDAIANLDEEIEPVLNWHAKAIASACRSASKRATTCAVCIRALMILSATRR